MSQAEMKEAIIRKVQALDDDDVLDTILTFLADDSGEEYLVSDAQWNAIQEADRQIDAGQFLTHEQATKQWQDLLSR